MQIDEIRRILSELSREVRGDAQTIGRAERIQLAQLADHLQERLSHAQSIGAMKSDTISTAPANCPCCGK